jgi:hypothetical protein
MREIKFRIWTENSLTQKKTMYYSNNEDDLPGPGYHVTPFGCFGDESYKFMQYTGLKDKNGKEIYEGDLVKKGKFVHEVIYDEKRCMFTLDHESENWTYLGPHGNELEVVGNILDETKKGLEPRPKPF